MTFEECSGKYNRNFAEYSPMFTRACWKYRRCVICQKTFLTLVSLNKCSPTVVNEMSGGGLGHLCAHVGLTRPGNPTAVRCSALFADGPWR